MLHAGLLLSLALLSGSRPAAPSVGNPTPAADGGSAAQPAGQGEAQAAPPVRRGYAPVDRFHPDRETKVQPAYGGTVSVLLFGLPASLCYPIDNSSYTRRILREVHETLIQRDWESWEWVPRLASGWDTEDTLILKGGRGKDNSNIVYGKVTDGGDHWIVEPVSKGNPLKERREIPKADVESLERETVYTFHLRPNILWHDEKPLTTRDVVFSWRIYQNPNVKCDNIRAYYDRIVQCEPADEHAVRFFFREQYFNVLNSLEDFIILPAHLYDLSDPENGDYDPNASPAKQGKYINENPHNTDWVGLGPYRIKVFDHEKVEATRFDEYFDPQNAGYFDKIRWRVIQNDDAAFQALINGDLDFSDRVSSDNYFGSATQDEAFTDKFYKGYYYTPGYNYTGWNLRRPQFADLQVRLALAHCFDFEEYKNTVAHGLAEVVTGPQFYFGDSYDHSVKPLAFDLDQAQEMLAEAGWYDRDGDGILDNADGVKFEFEFLTSNGNTASKLFSQKLQENLGKVGIKMDITQMDWASFKERVDHKDFDAMGLAWSLGPEDDPEQLWSSKGAPLGVHGSNHCSVSDPQIDELIAKGQRELDPDKRHEIWKELHRYLYYKVQPYLFRLMPPHKFAMSKRIRGMQTFALDPGYSIRRWFLPAGTPGTRPE